MRCVKQRRLNKIESVILRKCPYDRRLTNKAYLSAIAVTNDFSEFLPTRWRQKSTGIDMKLNYVTVTPCVSNAVRESYAFTAATQKTILLSCDTLREWFAYGQTQ